MSVNDIYCLLLLIGSVFINSTDAILTFTAYEGTEICLNFEQNVTDENSVIKVNNKDNLPIIVWIGKNNDWQLHLYEQYKNRIRTNDSPFNTLEFCFLNVSRDDAGIFYWNSENITLNVWYGPKDILLSPELQLISVLDEHSSLKINCSADCNPECQISWWKESKKLSFPVSNGLVLTDVSITDSGNYTCVAKNPEKNSSGIFKSLQIYVKYESEMDFTPNQVLEVKEHNDINVSCNYENYPLSNALWLRNGDRLDTTVKRKNEVVLHLFNNTCNNTGIYECSIFNNFGMKVTKLINLEVLCQPRFIGDTSKYTVTKKIEGTIGEKIIMNEKVQANPAPDLKFVSQDVDVSFLSLSNTLYSMFISILISSESNFRWYSVTIGNSEGNITLYIEVEKTSKLVYDYKFFIGISVSFFAFTFISTLIYKVIKRGIQNRGNQTESFSADYADAEVVLQEIHSLIDYDLEDANLYENRVREIELAATESYENLAIYGCTTPYEEMTNKKGMVKSDTSIERASTKAESSETECSMKIDEDGYLIITDMTAMESSKERFNSQPKELNISTKDDESYMKMNVPGTPIRHNTI